MRNNDRLNKNSRRKNRKMGMAMGDRHLRDELDRTYGLEGEVKEKREKLAPRLGAQIDGAAMDGVKRRRGAGFRRKK